MQKHFGYFKDMAKLANKQENCKKTVRKRDGAFCFIAKRHIND